MMEWNESLRSDHVRAAADAGELAPALAPSRHSPEDGLRLVRAFLSIPQRNVREAIIELVTKLSAVDLQRK
jgi:hypothetical protein